jgi:hypothetical protein
MTVNPKGMIPNVQIFNTLVVNYQGPDDISAYIMLMPLQLLRLDSNPKLLVVYIEKTVSPGVNKLIWITINEEALSL